MNGTYGSPAPDEGAVDRFLVEVRKRGWKYSLTETSVVVERTALPYAVIAERPDEAIGLVLHTMTPAARTAGLDGYLHIDRASGCASVSPAAIRLGMTLRPAELFVTALPAAADPFTIDWAAAARAWSTGQFRMVPELPEKAYLGNETLAWQTIETRLWVVPPRLWQMKRTNSPVADATKWLRELGIIVGGEVSSFDRLRVTTRHGYNIAYLPTDDEDGVYSALLRFLHLI